MILALIIGRSSIWRQAGPPALLDLVLAAFIHAAVVRHGALTAIFFYWGWDVTMNLTEETKGGTPDPASLGAFWAMINLILLFCIMMIVVLIVLTDDEIAKANTNVLYAIAAKLFPKPWSYLAVLSTLLSTIGTLETQILQFSRSVFAMARDDMLHSRLAKIHPEWRTPWLATLAIWFSDPRRNHKHRRDRRHRDRLCAFVLRRFASRQSGWRELIARSRHALADAEVIASRRSEERPSFTLTAVCVSAMPSPTTNGVRGFGVARLQWTKQTGPFLQVGRGSQLVNLTSSTP